MSMRHIALILILVSPCLRADEPSRESILRGTVLFKKRGCANCHSVDGQSESLGPNLGSVKEKLSRNEAIENIVNPSKVIRKGFESAVVVTVDGKVRTGRLVKSTDELIALMVSADDKVTTHEIRREDVEELQMVQTSIMPTDLLKGLSPTQTDHLLNYMVSVGAIDPNKPNQPIDAHDSHHHAVMSVEYSGPDTRPVFDVVEHDIRIDVIPKKMQYDVELFDVRPGARVRLTLTNRDEMQHNLFVCAEGKTTWLDVARAAWALGPQGPSKRYVPDSDQVLHHTRLVGPDSSDTIYFRAPEDEGVYPYVCTIPGHAFLMRGEMHVMQGTRGLSDLTYRYYEGGWQNLPNFASLTPVHSGPVPGPLPSIRTIRDRKSDSFAVTFDATLNVVAAGEYKFYLVSDDGSRIVIDDQTVVDYDGIHAEGDQHEGKVHLASGKHRFQMQFFEAGGGEALYAAWSGPGFKMLPLTSDRNTLDRFLDTTSFRMLVDDEPRVMRLNMPDATARAIAVGLIGGTNYCFDATTCHVKYGWTGDFLDVGPDRGYGRGRGGQVCKPLGEIFRVANDSRSLRIGSAEQQSAAEFQGYRRSILGPTFLYAIGKTRVEQSVEGSESGRGLKLHFRLIPPPQQPVTFQCLENMQLTASIGTVADNVLTVPASDAGSFRVVMEPKR